MSLEQDQIEASIIALEAQRALLGDAVVNTALASLRAQLATLGGHVAESPTQTLKLATILFLDIVGSTKLSEQLDPEETSAVMDGALAQFAEIVVARGGKVLGFAGDSVLAVFGADKSLEADAECAVRTGLALLEAGRQQSEMIHRQFGHEDFNIRVGIHTGGVLLGGGVDGGDSIRGQAVNIAARMEQTTPPGTLRISHDTYRHVRGVFEVEPQPPLSVKGVEEPVATYLVHSIKPRAFRVASRGIEGVETRMIGRDAELEQLQAAFRRLFDQRRLSTITIVAEAGLGKSRLLYEFRNWAEARTERFTIFQGRATPDIQGQAYGLMRDVLAWRFEIADTDSMEVAKAKLVEGIAPLFSDESPNLAQAHLLGHLIGMDFSDSPHVRGIADDPRQIRNRGFHAASELFRLLAAADGVPIILYLDDVHWADDGSLDFLNYLVEVNRDVPMMVLSLTRPELFERRTDRHGSDGVHLRIDLEPLDKRAGGDLALELLKRLPEVPAALRELITSGAEGNPFYMEELVKMLVDQGAIATGPEHWTLHAERLLATEVPATLTGVLQARLDGLPAAERLALQQASVIGLVFWDQALAALDPKAPESLPALVRRELALPRTDTALEGVEEYAFRHQILHQVTYDSVLKRNRRELHLRAAAWLAGLTGSRATDFLAATASHYELAGDTSRAREYFTRAAEQAKARFAHDATIAHVTRALGLLEDDAASGYDAPLRWRLLDVRERTMDLLGKRDEQSADIYALDALAELLNDDRRRAEVAWRRGQFAISIGDYRTAEITAREGMTLARAVPDDTLRLLAQVQLAMALFRLGDSTACMTLAHDGLAAARALGFHYVETRFLNALAMLAYSKNDHLAMLELSQQQLLICRKFGYDRLEAVALSNVGRAWLSLGEHVQARRYLDEGLRATRALRDRSLEPSPLCCLSLLALREGDDTLALMHAQGALDIASQAQARRFEVQALWHLGNAELALGRHSAASAAFARSHKVALAIGEPLRHNATAGLARVALAQGDVGRAMLAIESPLEDLSGGGTLDGAHQPNLIRLICYQVLAYAGDSRASDTLARAYATVQNDAAAIADTRLRQCHLDIPEHQEIIKTYVALTGKRPVTLAETRQEGAETFAGRAQDD